MGPWSPSGSVSVLGEGSPLLPSSPVQVSEAKGGGTVKLLLVQSWRQVLLSFYSRSWKEHVCSFSDLNNTRCMLLSPVPPGPQGRLPKATRSPVRTYGDVPSSLPGCPGSPPGPSLMGRWTAIVKICAQNKGCDAQGPGQSGPP